MFEGLFGAFFLLLGVLQGAFAKVNLGNSRNMRYFVAVKMLERYERNDEKSGADGCFTDGAIL